VGDIPFELNSPDDYHHDLHRFDSICFSLKEILFYPVDSAYYVTIVAPCETDDISATPYRHDVVVERSLRTDVKASS